MSRSILVTTQRAAEGRSGRIARSAAGGPCIRWGLASTLVAMGLTERDKAILDFERSWWTGTGSKADAVRERFELSTTRYYELLREITGDPEALEYDPLLVRRLNKERDRRRRERYEARPATEWRSR